VGNIAASSFSGGGFTGSNFANESHADKTPRSQILPISQQKRGLITQITQ
jgi:hypothetical protein